MATTQRQPGGDWKRAGAFVARRRGVLHMRQKDLAEAARVGITFIRDLEGGVDREYGLNNLAAISHALKLPADTLERVAAGEEVSENYVLDARVSALEDTVRALQSRLESHGVWEARLQDSAPDDESDGPSSE